MTTAYDPSKQYEIKGWDVEFRRDPVRTLMARVYQPQGDGPFPALLDLHGGAWNNQDRTANARMDERLAAAASGWPSTCAWRRRRPIQPPYRTPTMAFRWLKAKAREWKATRRTVGASAPAATSSNCAPCARRLARLQGASVARKRPAPDATVTSVATRSPVTDPFARYQQAERMKRAEMIQNTKIYFNPWETIYDGNPQMILDRGETVSLPPLLIMQGELDDNVLPAIQEKFAASYRAAGGECQLEIFAGCEHMWVKDPGPQTDRAIEMVKAFIARQLRARRLAA